MIKLRPYQEQSVYDCRRAYANGHRHILLVQPTGAGKTVVASHIIENAVSKHKHVLFLAHRREIIQQTVDKLRSFGVHAGVLMAGESRDMYAKCHVASVQTLDARAFRKDNLRYLPDADIVVIDEAHRSMAKTYLQVVEHYCDVKGAMLLGLTATPIRGDGKGLGNVYTSMALGPSVAELMQHGYLVPVEYYVPTIPDLSNVNVRRGDYVETELERIMNTPKLVGDVIDNFQQIQKINGQRKAVVFASGVKHSMALAQAFNEAGIRAAHVDGSTELEERDQANDDLRQGNIDVICNCQVYTEGWDAPWVKHLVLARPTKSLGLYLQMAGRALRPSEESGFDNMVMQDHAGAVYEHGRIDEPIPWQLDERGDMRERAREQRKREPKLFTCEACNYTFSGTLECPQCGTEIKITPEMEPYIEGDLVKMTRGEEERLHQESAAGISLREFFREMKWIQKDKKYKLGWVRHQAIKYFELKELAPEDIEYLSNCSPKQPRRQLVTWVEQRMKAYRQHMQIKNAKRREKAQREETERMEQQNLW